MPRLPSDGGGPALLVVLETLSPAERLAFVLHDMFGVPFGEISPIVGRPPPQGSSPAVRRRVRGSAPVPAADLARQREVVGAFLAAAHDGDLGALSWRCFPRERASHARNLFASG